MSTYYIYELWNPINNQPFYVGLGKENRVGGRDRHTDHLIEAVNYKKNNVSKKGANLHKIRTILKIIDAGYDIDIRIVNNGLTVKQANKKETELIDHYGRSDLKKGPLTNLTDGGEGWQNLSPDIRKKMVESMKGQPSPHKGKTFGPHSPERIENMSIAIKKAYSEMSDEQKEANRLKLVGKIPWNKGLTKETDTRIAKYADTKTGTARPDMVGKKPWNTGLTKDNDKRLRETSDRMKGNIPHNKGKPSPNKGKTYEELYGPEKAKELKELRRKAKLEYWR